MRLKIPLRNVGRIIQPIKNASNSVIILKNYFLNLKLILGFIW